MKKTRRPRTWLITTMKLSAIQVFIALLTTGLSLARPTVAQDLLDRRITLRLEAASLRAALAEIGQVADVKFTYNSRLLANGHRISVEARDERLEALLDRLLRPLGIGYTVVSRQIILKAVPTVPQSGFLGAQPEEVPDVTVSGRVTDQAGAGLPAVNVAVKGTTRGTTTDGDGRYRLAVPDGSAVLVFSSVGYEKLEVPVGYRTVVDVAMKADVTALDEVVVVGYGTQKKSDLTGSVASVKAKDLTAFPIVNPVQGLQGRAAGVQVSQNSGEPGSTLSVRIRGGNSLRASNEPLYVVDGFALAGGPSALNPNDIESVEVLKDASATAIYGSRGSNGVVMITTKQGKNGQVRVDLDSYYGFQSVIRRIDLLTGREFALLANERAANDGAAPFFTPQQVDAFGEGTNWQNELFRTAPIQNQSLRITGGTDKTTYSVSGNYLSQQGIIRGSDYWKGTLATTLNTRLSPKFTLSNSLVLSRTSRNQLNSDNSSRGNGVMSALLVAPPTIAPYDASGNYSNLVPYTFSPTILTNPLAWALEVKNNPVRNYLLTNVALSFQPVSGLTLRSSVGLEYDNTRTDFYSTKKVDSTPTGSASTTLDERQSLLNENILTYARQWNQRHSLTFTGGVTVQSFNVRRLNVSGIGFASDVLGTSALQTASAPGIPSSSQTKSVLASYLGRANYAYRDRYLLTASLRADGSSVFGINNKWGTFPSAALAWRVIEEEFAKRIPALSDLKLRVSWGKTGNTALDPYQSLNTLAAYPAYFSGLAPAPGFAPGTALANPDLKWESATQTDVGLEIGLLSNRFLLTVDYYDKITTDLLATVNLATSSGYTSVLQNVGSIRNRGWEFTLNANLLTNAFKWNVAANLSANRNQARKLAGGRDLFGTPMDIPLQVSINLVREGLPVGVFYGYQETGLDDKGNIVFADVDNNGVINANDRVVIGNPNPDFIYGFNSSMTYKNFELNFFLQGVQGADIFNFNKAQNANSFNFGENQTRDSYLNRWTPQNPNPAAPYPRVSVNTRFRESNRYVEDGSYLRLRTIQLAYNVPTEKLGVRWLRSAQAYVSGQNLLTLTRYSWFDPEVSTRGGAASISPGIDQNGYPTAKTYTVGLRIGL